MSKGLGAGERGSADAGDAPGRATDGATELDQGNEPEPEGASGHGGRVEATIDAGPTHDDVGMASGGDGGTPDEMEECACGAGQASLACLCEMIDCPRVAVLEEQIAEGHCNPGPDVSVVQRGCGKTSVTLRAGLGSTVFVYSGQGPEAELIGASLRTDVVAEGCDTGLYSTPLPKLAECEDYSICDLCEGGPNERCE